MADPRKDGEFMVPRVWLHDLDDDDSTRAGEGANAAAGAGDADGAQFIEITGDKVRDEDEENIRCAIRSGCGVAQGCPCASFTAC
jgi:hypothetical protein